MLTISVFIFVLGCNVHHLDAIIAPIGYLKFCYLIEFGAGNDVESIASG